MGGEADPLEAILLLLRGVLGSEARETIEHVLTSDTEPSAMHAARVFPGLARRTGRAPLPTTPTLKGPTDAVPTSAWTLDVAARVAVLLAVARRQPDALVDTATRVYRAGDTSEKIAVLRCLPLLEDGERLVSLALDAGRTNETPLFAAIATHNPFPARHYPELEFDKLVMKAAFLGLGLDHVVGVVERANAELARMALDHIDERESAGRSFTPTIWLAITPALPAEALPRMVRYAAHDDEEHRVAVARGLAVTKDPALRALLEERLSAEPSPRVRAVLEAARAPADRRE